MSTTKEKSLLILILLASALLRCSLLWSGLQQTTRLYTPDSEGYCNLATELAEHGRFQLDDKPVIFRTPGYPIFLTLLKNLPTAGVLGIQIALDVAVVLMTFLLGSWLMNARAGIWSAVFYAISPLALAGCCRFLSDSLYVFFFMLSVLMMVKFLQNSKPQAKTSADVSGAESTARPAALIGAAIFISLACYVRPVGLAMLPLFIFALLFRPSRLKQLITFAGIVIMCLGPWVGRNMIQADYIGFSSFAGDSMYNTTAADIIAKQQNMPAEEIRNQFIAKAAEYQAGPPLQTPGQTARWRQKEALRIIRDNPKLWLSGYLKGCVGFWLPGANYVLELLGQSQGQRGTLDVLQRQGIWAASKHYLGGNYQAVAIALPMILIMLIKYLGVILCVIRKIRLRIPLETWLIVGIFLITAFLPGPGLPRYRLPIEPIIAIAAAAGWMRKKQEQDPTPVSKR